MWRLNDEQLVHSYRDAVDMGLEEEFIRLLRKELARRGLLAKPVKHPA